MKKWGLGVVLILVVVSVAFAYSRSGSGKDDKGQKFVDVELGTLVDKALVTGEIVPRQEIEVKSKISGTVARIFVEEGGWVNQGDPVIEVKPSPTPLEYAQKKRTLEMRVLVDKQRSADLQRVQGLLNRGMVSQADYDTAWEAAERAELNRKMAEEELSILDRGSAVVAGRAVESVIVSPVAGHVLKQQVDVGDPVVPLTSYQPGTELMTIANMDDLLLKGTVDEIDVGKIREGMSVEIKIGAFPNRTVEGTLRRISLKSQKLDNATVFSVEIDQLKSPEDIQLRAGYSANADVIVRQVEGVPVIPERVITFRGDSTFVQLQAASSDGQTEQPLVLGMSDGITVEVKEGLKVGDRILEPKTREIK